MSSSVRKLRTKVRRGLECLLMYMGMKAEEQLLLLVNGWPGTAIKYAQKGKADSQKDSLKKKKKKKSNPLKNAKAEFAGQEQHRNRTLAAGCTTETSVCARREPGELQMSQAEHCITTRGPHTSHHSLQICLGTEPRPPINCSPLIRHSHTRQAFLSKCSTAGLCKVLLYSWPKN